MMHRSRFVILNFLMILALVTLNISPACQFLSGQNVTAWLEICGVDGLTKVQITHSEKTAEDATQNGSHLQKPPCAFCVTHAHQTLSWTAEQTVLSALLYAQGRSFFQAGAYVTQTWSAHFQTRAPPPQIFFA